VPAGPVLGDSTPWSTRKSAAPISHGGGAGARTQVERILVDLTDAEESSDNSYYEPAPEPAAQITLAEIDPVKMADVQLDVGAATCSLQPALSPSSGEFTRNSPMIQSAVGCWLLSLSLSLSLSVQVDTLQTTCVRTWADQRLVGEQRSFGSRVGVGHVHEQRSITQSCCFVEGGFPKAVPRAHPGPHHA
jgi:hypothetical protein